jgi:hypothetical protein
MFLVKAGINEAIGKATFIIENGRFIKKSEANAAIKKLFDRANFQSGPTSRAMERINFPC